MKTIAENGPHRAEDLNLSGSQFHDVNLASCQFHKVNLAGADFDDVNLSHAKFHNINLSDIELAGVQIGGAKFKHIGLPPDQAAKTARQRPVTFEEATLCDSVFRKVDLSNVAIVDCHLAGMTIDGILVTDLLAAFGHKMADPPERIS